MCKIDRKARILILGAGPGGLAAAYYLRKYGYKNVTVFEKLGRVGGLCRTVTEDYQSFDLGAVSIMLRGSSVTAALSLKSTSFEAN